MEEINNFEKTNLKKNWENIFLNSLIIGLSFLITLPLFIIVYRYVPDLKLNLGKSFRIDHIITFLFIFFIFFAIFKLINKLVVYYALMFFFIFITFNQFFGYYGVKALINDYKDLLNYFEDNPINIPFLADEKMTIRNASKIRSSADYNNPIVRDFAVKSSLEYFNNPNLYAQYQDLVRYLSIFKVMHQWKYVKDPSGEDYYSKASESVGLMAGDCDDYSILMASMIRAIGGEPRIIHTVNHLYPEVKIGTTKDLEKVIYLIKSELFYKESIGKKIYYHLDSEGNVWLNFDYSGDYPGAKFMNTKVMGILTI